MIRQKSPRALREKVSAPRRQLGKIRERATELASDAHVELLARHVGQMIEAARHQVAVAANASLTTLYWQVGHRVRTDALAGRRAEYGAQVVAALGHQLETRYGRGFGEKSLRHMIRFAEAFPDAEIVSALRRQLSWSHFKQIIYIAEDLKRNFYAEMCRIEGWSTRVLALKVSSMLYERTAFSKKPQELIRRELAVLREKGDVSPAMVFRDPYMLDFLQLSDTYSEKDLESALLREIERFLLELGSGFAFVERQSESRSTATTSTSTSCYSTVACAGSSRSNSKLVTSNLPIPVKWNSICAGSISTSAKHRRNRHSASSSAPVRSARPLSTSI